MPPFRHLERTARQLRISAVAFVFEAAPYSQCCAQSISLKILSTVPTPLVPHIPLNQHIPVLSFFTGGGLLDIGFEEAGFDIAWTNELDPAFASLYAVGLTSWRQHHRPDAPAATISHVGSLLDLTPAEIVTQAFPAGVPPLFGIIGGPPCQDFSIAGTRQGIEGARGKISPAYCKIINDLRPAFFVFENVSGLLEKKHRAEFDKIRADFNRQYITDFAKLNALDYGVPQSRERLIMIGLRRDLVKAPTIGIFSDELPSVGWAKWSSEQSHAEIRRQFTWPGVEPKDTTPLPPTNAQQLELCVSNCLLTKADIDNKVANGHDRFNLISEKPAKTPEGLVANRSFKRLHRYRYSPTACYGNNEVHLHPFEDRRLSVREVLRIQGVSEHYKLPEGAPLSVKFKMIGNGVPVPMANGVARTITRLLHEYCGIQLGPVALVTNKERKQAFKMVWESVTTKTSVLVAEPA